MGVLNPCKQVTPSGRVTSSDTPQGCLKALIGPFSLPIRLGMVARRETDRGPNPLAEGLPHPGSELGSTVRDDVLRDPCNRTTWVVRRLAFSAEDGSFGSATKCACLENLSTIVKITELPLDTGRPVTKSNARCDQSRLGTGSGQRSPAGGWREVLLRAQVTQADTNSRVSASIVGHQNRHRRNDSPSGPRVAGEPARMAPFEDVWADRGGHKQAVGGSVPRSWMGTLGGPDNGVNGPGDHAHNPVRAQDWGRGVILRRGSRVEA